MKILKYLLAVILTCVLIWLSLIIAGPAIVRLLVSQYFGDRLAVHGVAVTPQLGIKIRSAEFTSRPSEPLNEVKLHARSIYVKWGLFSPSSSPFVSLAAGSVNINRAGSLAKLKLDVSVDNP